MYTAALAYAYNVLLAVSHLYLLFVAAETIREKMKAAEGLLFLLLARSVTSSSNESGEFAALIVHTACVYTTFCRMTVNVRDPSIIISGKCGIHRL